MQNNQNFRITEDLFMPYCVMHNKKFNSRQRIILAWVIQHSPYRANSLELATLISGSTRTAQRTLRELCAMVYIVETKNDGRGKTYKSVDWRVLNG